MKRKQLSEWQTIGTLKDAEARTVVTVLFRKHGMPSVTYYALEAKHGGLEVSEAKRLRALGTKLKARAAACRSHA